MIEKKSIKTNKLRFQGLSFSLATLLVFFCASIQLKAQKNMEQFFQKKVSSLLSNKAFKRLQRYRPLAPFDESPFYTFLDIPLQEGEAKSSKTARLISDIVFGPSFQLSPKLKLSIDGLVYLIPDYSQQEGFWLGYEAMLDYQLGLGRKLSFRTSHNYTTKSHSYYHEHKVYYYFSPENDGLLLLSGGQTSRETLPETKGEQYTQKFINPIGANNKVRDFKKNFLSLRGTSYLTPKLNATFSLLYEDRKPCFDKGLSEEKILLSELNLLYDFALKAPMSAEYPSGKQLPYGYYSLALGLNLRQTFTPSFLSLEEQDQFTSFTMLEGTLRSAWADNFFLHRLSFFGGGFIGKHRLGLLDGRHFRRLTIVTAETFDNAWATIPRHSFMNNQWAGLYWTGKSQNLLLSRTFIGSRGLGFDEGLHFKFVSDIARQNYAEFGYSLGWDNFFRLGVFVGTDFSKSKPSWHFALNIPISLLTSQWGERY